MATPKWVQAAAAFLSRRERDAYAGARVIVESPFAGDVRKNRAYLKACLRDSLGRGEHPFASHAAYTGVLADADPAERLRGMNAGLAWAKAADVTAVYADLGITSGMARGIQDAHEMGRQVTVRFLRGRWKGESDGAEVRGDAGGRVHSGVRFGVSGGSE